MWSPEERAMGIPTIQDELRKNSSPAARIETDEERSCFLLEIPCREGFSMTDVLSQQKSELKSELKSGLKKESKILDRVLTLMFWLLVPINVIRVSRMRYDGVKKMGKST